MRYEQKPLDICGVLSATWLRHQMVQSTLERAEQYKTDPDKKARRKKQECMPCFYNKARIGGSAMTDTNCRLCDTEMMFGNTCVDALCLECAKEKDLCKYCGGDYRLRFKRRKL